MAYHLCASPAEDKAAASSQGDAHEGNGGAASSSRTQSRDMDGPSQAASHRTSSHSQAAPRSHVAGNVREIGRVAWYNKVHTARCLAKECNSA
eukprot:scaffold361754_cov35-Prasinocladus_malaysianus.AAC.1